MPETVRPLPSLEVSIAGSIEEKEEDADKTTAVRGGVPVLFSALGVEVESNDGGTGTGTESIAGRDTTPVASPFPFPFPLLTG